MSGRIRQKSVLHLVDQQKQASKNSRSVATI
jgi:hypothetical protein